MAINFRLQGITQTGPTQPTNLTFIQAGRAPFTIPTDAATSNPGIYTATVTDGRLNPGTYDILIKTNSHLQRRFSAVDISGTSNNSILIINLDSQELIAGDVNHDNQITVDDIAAINSLYQGIAGQFSFPVPAGTPEDINGDGYISILDLALALLNYQDFVITGDE